MATFADVPSPECVNNVLIFGATGAIGRHLVALCMLDPTVRTVHAVSRNELTDDAEKRSRFLLGEDVSLTKLKCVKLDWEEYMANKEAHSALFTDINYVAFAMGTTRADAGSAENFRRVDYDYTLHAARHAKESGVATVGLVSSTGASENSWFLYPQVKGEIERDVKALGFPTVLIYRPGLLNRDDKLRSHEALLVNMLRVPAIPCRSVAGAMVHHIATGFMKGNNGVLVFNTGIYQADNLRIGGHGADAPRR
jgi:oxidoreductase